MNTQDILATALAPGHTLSRIDDGIFSALGAGAAATNYDRAAGFYDAVVGSALYNRIMWGSSPVDYAGFARTALATGEGLFLDAGCGSMVFTANAYVASRRPIIAIDRSIGMLRRARARLASVAGGSPTNVVFLQADLHALPFRPHVFETVMSMGMLHLFDDAAGVASRLEAMTAAGGSLHMTSLVANGRFGDRYLRALHRAGEVALPRSAAELRTILESALRSDLSYRTRGNMAYVSV